MNTETAEILCKINNDFYRNQSASFSATRTSPWTGWERCCAIMRDAGFGAGPDLSVFDLACGNLRFEVFLESVFPEPTITFHTVDNCDRLVPQVPLVNYQSIDVMGLLLDGFDVDDRFTAPTVDLSVSFGFMHHIPRQEYREEILSSLVRRTHSGGYVIVSFWQFLNNSALADKAQTAHEQALEELGLPALDENDFLLGWKNIPGAYRYCHSFSEDEIDRLIEALGSRINVISRFVADGRSDNLNTYLVLEVR